MSDPISSPSLNQLVDLWRSYRSRQRGVDASDTTGLEGQLRQQISGLTAAGLALDEAFLIGVKRIGLLDPLSGDFAREHSERLWHPRAAVTPLEASQRQPAQTEAFIAFGLAAAAAVLLKLPSLFGIPFSDESSFYPRNVSLFVLPALVSYLAWKRRHDARTVIWLVLAFLFAAAVVNLYPFTSGGSTEVLSALHLPVALWLPVGFAYAGSRWREVSGRMDFVRFTGELFIYYVLLALGGGLLTGFMMLMFQTIGIDAEWFVESWLAPCGAAGGVVVAAWLVESKQGVIGNLAPLLTRLFSPLFAAVLLTFLVTLVWTGRGVAIERDMLIAFDGLLILVLALLLYSVSARDPLARPGAFDLVQVVLVVSALIADTVALWAIAARITEFGLSPNRAAALGLNLILLVNLVWSAVLYVRFLRRRRPFGDLERWQTGFLPVFATWAAIVTILFPPLFRFL